MRNRNLGPLSDLFTVIRYARLQIFPGGQLQIWQHVLSTCATSEVC